MNREQAINYLISSGFTHEQVGDVVRALTYEPTTKNDLPRFLHTDEEDEEIAKSFIEDVEAVKDQLPCFCEQMDFPNTFDEFADYYGFKDTEEVYTNGNELIQVFRVKQWLEHISTTKNDLGVDNQNIRLIDANALIKRLLPKYFDWWGEGEQDDFSKGNNSMLEEVINAIEELPSVTPQPKWIPVSERLPEAGEYIGDVARYYLVQNEYGDMMVASYDGIGWQQMYQHGYVEDKVVAWMTLPQKYREVKE